MTVPELCKEVLTIVSELCVTLPTSVPEFCTELPMSVLELCRELPTRVSELCTALPMSVIPWFGIYCLPIARLQLHRAGLVLGMNRNDSYSPRPEAHRPAPHYSSV